jgi:hypothetical protein
VTRNMKIGIALGALGGGYLVWREHQRSQVFAFAAGRSYLVHVTGTSTTSPPTVASAQAIVSAQNPAGAIALSVQAVVNAGSATTLQLAALAPSTMTGAQLAAAVGKTQGSIAVSVDDNGPIVAAVSGLSRQRVRVR